MFAFDVSGRAIPADFVRFDYQGVDENWP